MDVLCFLYPSNWHCYSSMVAAQDSLDGFPAVCECVLHTDPCIACQPQQHGSGHALHAQTTRAQNAPG